MKAMYIDAPGQVSIKDVEMPVRKEGEVLLKILYGGICGSDLGSYRGTFAYFDYPRIPGHEFSAEVIEADENNAYGIKPGNDRNLQPVLQLRTLLFLRARNRKRMYGQPDNGMSERRCFPGVHHNADRACV